MVTLRRQTCALYLAREPHLLSGRTDGVKRRCTAGASLTVKQGRRNLEKKKKKKKKGERKLPEIPKKSVTHMARFIMPSYYLAAC